MTEGGRQEEIQSSFERMSLGPKDSKKPNLPVYSVSKWNRKFAQRFGIYYAKEYLSTPSEVLAKAGKTKEFTHEQSIYMKTIKTYLHFDAMYEKNEEIHHEISLKWFYTKYLDSLFKKIRKLVNQHVKDPPPGEEQSLIYLYILARHSVVTFIEELTELLKVVHENANNYASNIPKDMYSELFQSFVNMCYLKVRLGSASPTHWYGLLELYVTSKPDYRLIKRGSSFGMDDDEDGSAVVSIVEMKRGRQQKDSATFKKRYKSSASSSCSSKSLHSSFEHESEKKKHNPAELSSCSASSQESIFEAPAIEHDLGSRVLGQHAGELLLELKQYDIRNTMPGIKENGTKIKRGRQQDIETLKKRYKSSASASHSSQSLDSSFEHESEKKKHIPAGLSLCRSSSQESISEAPEIEHDLGSRVLGQHAGELLLDLKQYGIRNTMPGIIVHGTKVYFTLLEMSGTHFVKLYSKKKLDKDEDRATIHYSRPLDILVEEDRNILIESFMRFNNFQQVTEAVYNID